jgi:hypothetical protein
VVDYPLDDVLLSELRAARPPYEAADSISAGVLLARITTSQESGVARQPRGAASRASGVGQIRLPRTRTAWLATIAGLAAAGLALGFAITGNTGPEANRPVPETGAQLLARIGAAIAAPPVSGDLIRVHYAWPGGYSLDAWFGPRNGPVSLRSYGPGGHLLFAVGETASTVTIADYANRTWWSEPSGPSAVLTWSGCGLPHCYVIYPGNHGQQAMPLSPAVVSAMLQARGYQVGAVGVIHGQRAEDLVPTASPTVATGSLWVTTAGFLPLRWVWTAAGTTNRTQIDIYYLQPTASNLARLSQPIPRGFTHLPSQP